MRSALFRIDWWLLLPVLVLLLFSFATLFSLSPDFLKNQSLSLMFAIAAFIFFSQLNVRSFVYFTLPIYLVSILLLFLVLVIGFESRGAVRWIEVFGISLQFSEILKPFLMIALAGFVAARDRYSLKSFFLLLALTAPLVLLINSQPDLGNALIYLGVMLLTLFLFGYPFLWFLFLLIPILVAAPIIWTRLHEYQRLRVLTFLNPAADPQGTSYNAIQAIIAVGSGMFFGRGAHEGTQSGLLFLPERQTDFIFATVAETYGFVGACAVILSFIFLFYRIFRIVRDSESAFNQVFSLGTLVLLFIHFFVNIGMNIGIFPIVGVTLPFVSFGGSSLLANFILLGVLSSISTTTKRQEALEIR